MDRGAHLLVIDASGNDPTPDSTYDDSDSSNDGDGSRVILIDDGFENAFDDLCEVALNGVTLTGGDISGLDGLGGAIKSHEQLTIVDCVVSSNLSSSGGAIFASGRLAISHSIVSGNNAITGGGIRHSIAGWPAGVELTIEDSVIRDNMAGRGLSVVGAGGGILTNGETRIARSTIADNHANTRGGGLSVGLYGLTLVDSTISGNTAALEGAGILATSDVTVTTPVVVERSTITQNRLTSNAGLGGGGIISSHPTTVRNSIIARNIASKSPDLWQGATLFYSIVGDSAGTSLAEAPVGSPDANGNLIGGPTNGVIDPLLGPLVNLGGPTLPDGSRTLTHALLFGSPAIDAGDPAAVAGMNGVPEFDQRRAPWERVAGGRIDMGAVEWQLNPLPGDYNFNGVVDAADYSVWRDTLGSTIDLRADGSSATAPGTSDGVVDEHDHAWWKANFGNVLGQGGAAVYAESLLQATDESSTAGRASSGTPAVDGELPLARVGEGDGDVVGNSVAAMGELRRLTVQAGPARRSSPAARVVQNGGVVSALRDEALVAWAMRRGVRGSADDLALEVAEQGDDGAGDAVCVSSLDEVFASLAGCGLGMR